MKEIRKMKNKARTAAAMTLALLVLAGLAACSQNEFTEAGPDPNAPKNPPPAQRVEKGEGMGMAEAPPPPEPQNAHFSGSVVLPPNLAPKVKPGMVLFVIAVVPGASKPVPVAAKRIPDLKSGAFPYAFDLGPQDSMSGEPLPPSLEIVVRLDSDGDLKTSAPDDLVAGPAPAQAGIPTELTLREQGR